MQFVFNVFSQKYGDKAIHDAADGGDTRDNLKKLDDTVNS